MTFSYLYRPRDWPTLATNLASAIAGNGVPIVDYFLEKVELNTTISPRTSAAIYAVTCVDTPPFPEDLTLDEALEDVLHEIELSQRLTSRHFSALDIDLCQHWTTRAVERFTGPFNHTLKNEILVIGNTADVSVLGIRWWQPGADLEYILAANNTRTQRQGCQQDDAPIISPHCAEWKWSK